MDADDFRPRREDRNRPKICKPNRASKHAHERAMQRYGVIIKDREIVDQIVSHQAIRVCDLEGTKSMYVVRIGSRPAFVVFDNSSRVVVTFVSTGQRDYRLVESLATVILNLQAKLCGARRQG